MSGAQPIPSVTGKELKIQNQLEKIRSLEDQLNRLNILENPLEIENICKSIIELKSALELSKLS